MRIAILDDYQDAVRKLNRYWLLAGHEVKIFNNTGKGTEYSRSTEVYGALQRE